MIDDLLAAEDGVILLREHPTRASTLQRATAAGVLTSLFPGVLVSAESATSPWIRLGAVSRWAADAVIVGVTALAILERRQPSPPFHLATRRRLTSTPKWLRLTRRAIPPQHVVNSGRMKIATPAYLAAELAATDQGRAAFEALRQRLVSPASLVEAATCFRGSRGQQARQSVIERLASNPWSFAEAKLHQLLVAAGIDGWVANHPLRHNGRVYYPDVRFLNKLLIIEVDGEAWHSDHEQFEGDRERQNKFALANYRILRFTWDAITNRPEEVIATVRAMLALL